MPDTAIATPSRQLFAKLVVIDGTLPDKQLVLRTWPVTIGRAESADVRLHDDRVSREHCILQERHGLLTVRDLGSSNGTFVNDLLVAESLLRPGDKLTVGKSTFLVCYKPAAAKSPPLTETTMLAESMERTSVQFYVEPGASELPKKDQISE